MRDGDMKYLEIAGNTFLLNVVGYFVGGIMGLGVVFGALNTMFSAVDARVREIATLRAIGFGGTAVVVSVITEALVLAIPGALLGSGFAWLVFNFMIGNGDNHLKNISYKVDAGGIRIAPAYDLLSTAAYGTRAFAPGGAHRPHSALAIPIGMTILLNMLRVTLSMRR